MTSLGGVYEADERMTDMENRVRQVISVKFLPPDLWSFHDTAMNTDFLRHG